MDTATALTLLVQGVAAIVALIKAGATKETVTAHIRHLQNAALTIRADNDKTADGG